MAVRVFAALIAVHGIALWFFAGMEAHVPAGVEELLFWILVVPALVLTAPLTAVLWALGLMKAPGWFAWPEPLGIALVYVVWVAGLLAVSAILRWMFIPSTHRPSHSP